MTDKQPNGSSWLASDNLIAWGLAISVAAHLFGYGGYRTGKHFGWWGKGHGAGPPKSVAEFVEEVKKLQEEFPLRPQEKEEEQMVFVEVDPNAAVPEPPKDTKNYPSHDSLAANPDPQLEKDVPKIDGTQTHVPKTEDVPRTK